MDCPRKVKEEMEVPKLKREEELGLEYVQGAFPRWRLVFKSLGKFC